MKGDYEVMEFFHKNDLTSSFLFFDWPVPNPEPRGWKGYDPGWGRFSGYVGITGPAGPFVITGRSGYSAWT